MRTGSVAVVLALAALPGRADDPDPKAVVEKAIAAVGGREKLDGLKGGVWKTSGTVQGRPSRAEFHGELPDKFRIDSTRVVDGKPVRHSRIVNGDKGWVVEGDTATPMTADQIAGVKTTFYHKGMATTLVPLTDRACRLTLVGRAEVGGKPATAIKASREGFPDVVLYFDAATGLLARTDTQDTRDGKPRRVTLEFAEYKEFDGIKLAGRTKTYHDGKLFLDTELVDFKKAASHPAGTFDKP